jgi:hypothetical protein
LPRAIWAPRIVPIAMALPGWLLTRIGCEKPIGVVLLET